MRSNLTSIPVLDRGRDRASHSFSFSGGQNVRAGGDRGRSFVSGPGIDFGIDSGFNRLTDIPTVTGFSLGRASPPRRISRSPVRVIDTSQVGFVPSLSRHRDRGRIHHIHDDGYRPLRYPRISFWNVLWGRPYVTETGISLPVSVRARSLAVSGVIALISGIAMIIFGALTFYMASLSLSLFVSGGILAISGGIMMSIAPNSHK